MYMSIEEAKKILKWKPKIPLAEGVRREVAWLKKNPSVWGANGLVYRTNLVRDIILRRGFIADNDVFQIMIESGNNNVAFATQFNIYHHHIKNLKQWVNKWRRDFGTHFLKHRESRNMGWAFDRNFKKKLVLWIFYSGMPFFSLIHAIYLTLRSRNIYWFYHPIASFLQLVTYSWIILTTKKAGLYLKTCLFDLNHQN